MSLDPHAGSIQHLRRGRGLVAGDQNAWFIDDGARFALGIEPLEPASGDAPRDEGLP